MIMVVLAISQAFVDSGFSQALIQKKECTDEDYSTVFLFNLSVSLVIYIILFISAPLISNFYNQPELTDIIKVLGINLLINGLSQIQITIRTKRLDFKLQTKVSVISNTSSGLIAVFMAYTGHGVWSLVWKSVTQSVISSALFWYWNNWYPSFTFNKQSLKEMFSYGSKLLLSGLIVRVYENIYYLVIGKFFSAADLGYYTKAESFNNLPSKNLTAVLNRVSFPVLATIQDDERRLKNSYKKLIKTTVFFSFTIMIAMSAASESLIIVLIGEKWRPAIPYLQLLCFGGMLYPLHSINLSMLKVKGRSDLFLKLEIIKRVLLVPVVLTGIYWGIMAMLIGMVIFSVFAYFLNSYWSGELIKYSMKEQLGDISVYFLLALIMGVTVYSLNFIFTPGTVTLLVSQFILGLILIIIFAELIKLESYLEVKKTFLNKFHK